MRALRRSLPGLLVAGLILASCGDTYQVAARIAGEEIGFDELEERAEAWVANPDFVRAVIGVEPTEPGSGRVDQGVVLTILSLEVRSTAARRALGEAGMEVDPALRQQLLAELETIAAEFDAATREEVVDLFAPLIQLQQQQVRPLPADDVYISPRLGSYDSTLGDVLGPAGPVAAPGELGLEP